MVRTLEHVASRLARCVARRWDGLGTRVESWIVERTDVGKGAGFESRRIYIRILLLKPVDVGKDSAFMSLSCKIKGVGIPIRVGTIKMTRCYILSNE